MSYFDDASLVMIPSGYKTSKVYSVKPTDGTGDLAFTRSNDTATRVGPDGLIEKVRTNLLLQSEAFNTTWATNASPTITANTTTAPNGTLTADTIAASAGSSGVYQYPSVNSGSAYAFSLYIKNISSATAISIGCDFSPSGGSLIFNAVTGTITSVGANVTASSVTNEGNGWYRVFGTYVSTGTNNTFIIYGGGVMSFAVWGAMLQESDVLTPYIATTTAAVSVGPVANVPRLDYLNSTCPRLLLEPQRVNKITYSENQGPTGTNWFPTTTWTVTNNTVTSPSGYQDADTLTETTSTGFHSGYYNATIESSYTGTYTISAFAKYNGRLFVLNPFGTGAGRTYFNLQTGTVAQAGTGVTASIVNYGNGWYRCICTASYSAEVVAFEHMLASAVGTLQYTGNGTSGVHIWGCTAEAGAYATSYIPTLGAAVTRGADAASKTSATALIGQTEGTLFVEVTDWQLALDTLLFSVSDGTFDNYLQISTNSVTGNLQSVIFTGGVATSLGITTPTVGQTVKIAVAYKLNDYALYVNGVQIGTLTSKAAPSSLTRTDVGSLAWISSGLQPRPKIAQTLLFKTRLTNAQLAELTA
jgi:hypothetical protein